MEEITYYLSPNDYPAFGLFGTSDPWGWRVIDSRYDIEDDQTIVTVELGYEGTEQQCVLYYDGNITGVEVEHVMTEPEFVDSDGPIKGQGFPPPPTP